MKVFCLQFCIILQVSITANNSDKTIDFGVGEILSFKLW